MGLKIRVSTVRFRLWPPLTNQALRSPIVVAFLLYGVTMDLQSACRVKTPHRLDLLGTSGKATSGGNFERNRRMVGIGSVKAGCDVFAPTLAWCGPLRSPLVPA